ncbi:DUF2690 domain-containing protein [Clavibacter sp. VKM Ac-2873]|nr:DUF2690 domain-containing protein [Clavibacter sp. VKM Ac-2873]
MLKSGLRKFRGVVLAMVVMVGILLPAGGFTGSTSAQAASCTDGAVTRSEFTVYGKSVQLRNSPNCGGTTWFRMNTTGAIGCCNGEVSLQIRDASGSIRTVASHDTFYTYMEEDSWVSAYVTGGSLARLTFKNLAGGQPSFTGAWVTILKNGSGPQSTPAD